jgi:BRCT domain type II-containing protein
MKTLFKIDSSGKEGHETAEDKQRKLKEYKELISKEYDIMSEKEVITRRGKFIEIIYE